MESMERREALEETPPGPALETLYRAVFKDRLECLETLARAFAEEQWQEAAQHIAMRRRGDLGISGERITAIGDLSAASAKTTINARGKIVAPGFIDTHTHSEGSLLIDPQHANGLRQGMPVTVRFEQQESGDEAVFMPVFTPDTTAAPSHGSS